VDDQRNEDSAARQRDLLAFYTKNVTTTVHVERLPATVLVTLITLATLVVLGVVAYGGGSTILGILAFVLWALASGYIGWKHGKTNDDKRTGPPESGHNSSSA
jgi:hypothetical protein